MAETYEDIVHELSQKKSVLNSLREINGLDDLSLEALTEFNSNELKELHDEVKIMETNEEINKIVSTIDDNNEYIDEFKKNGGTLQDDEKRNTKHLHLKNASSETFKRKLKNGEIYGGNGGNYNLELAKQKEAVVELKDVAETAVRIAGKIETQNVEELLTLYSKTDKDFMNFLADTLGSDVNTKDISEELRFNDVNLDKLKALYKEYQDFETQQNEQQTKLKTVSSGLQTQNNELYISESMTITSKGFYLGSPERLKAVSERKQVIEETRTSVENLSDKAQTLEEGFEKIDRIF